MHRSSNKLLCTGFAAFAILFGGAGPSIAVERPPSIIAEPYDQNPRAITRPAGKPDRDWRRGRAAPQLRNAPPSARVSRRPEAPRYDGRGRRVNVPGRPDTYDQIGRSRVGRPAVAQPRYNAPVVRTDAGTRINQFPPR